VALKSFNLQDKCFQVSKKALCGTVEPWKMVSMLLSPMMKVIIVMNNSFGELNLLGLSQCRKNANHRCQGEQEQLDTHLDILRFSCCALRAALSCVYYCGFNTCWASQDMLMFKPASVLRVAKSLAGRETELHPGRSVSSEHCFFIN